MEIINLISLETLKKHYGFDLNIDDNYVLPIIYKCQRLLLRPIFTDTKWNELLSYVKNLADGTIEPDEKMDEILEEYIEPAIAYYVRSEIIYMTSFKIKNMGSDGTEKFDEISKLSKKYLGDSYAFVKQLEEYMCENNIVKDYDYQPRNPGGICLDDTSYITYANRNTRTYNYYKKLYRF